MKDGKIRLTVAGIDPTDFPDMSDAYFSSGVASLAKKFVSLTNKELETLAIDWPEKLWDMAVREI